MREQRVGGERGNCFIVQYFASDIISLGLPLRPARGEKRRKSRKMKYAVGGGCGGGGDGGGGDESRDGEADKKYMVGK